MTLAADYGRALSPRDIGRMSPATRVSENQPRPWDDDVDPSRADRRGSMDLSSMALADYLVRLREMNISLDVGDASDDVDDPLESLVDQVIELTRQVLCDSPEGI